MITDELFSKEFETFHFTEIHRNPSVQFGPALTTATIQGGKILSGLSNVVGILTKIPYATAGTIFKKSPDLDAELEKELEKREPNFYDYLVYYMDQKHFDNEVDLYKKAEISRPVFSKIRSMRETDHRPSKPTVIKLCLALQLNVAETQEMINTVGYGMSNASVIDKIIMFFIEHYEFNIFEIDEKIYDITSQRYLIGS